MNKVIVLGNLGADPEMRFTPSGAPVASFRVAVTERYSQNGERHDRTEWFSVVAWDKLAEVVGQHLGKGSKVLVEGRLQSRSYEGTDGLKRTVWEIVAREIEILSWRQAEATGEPEEEQEEYTPAPAPAPAPAAARQAPAAPRRYPAPARG